MLGAVDSVADAVDVLGERAEAQLIALSAPSHATVDRALTRLAPDGTVYVEWRRPGLARRRIRALRHRGLRNLAAYALWPPTRRDTPLFWLPVEVPRAAAFLLRTRRGHLQFLRRIATRIVLELGPIAVVAEAQEGPPSGRVASALRASWTRWGLGTAPEVIDFLMMTGGRSELNKVVMLVFADGGRRPKLVLKVPRTASAQPGLRREARVLDQLPPEVFASVEVPRLLFAEEISGSYAVGETVVDGAPLERALGHDTYGALGERVAAMLCGWAGTGGRESIERSWNRLVAPVIRRFQAGYGHLSDDRLVDGLVGRLRALPPLPVVPEHRDCSPWNIALTGDGRLGLHDWESAELRGLPALDLLYYLAQAAFLVDGTLGSGDETGTYRRMRDPVTQLGRTYATIVDGYTSALRLDRSLIPTLSAFAWMLHSLSDLPRSGTATEGFGKPRSAGSATSLAYRLWKHEMTELSGG